MSPAEFFRSPAEYRSLVPALPAQVHVIGIFDELERRSLGGIVIDPSTRDLLYLAFREPRESQGTNAIPRRMEVECGFRRPPRRRRE